MGVPSAPGVTPGGACVWSLPGLGPSPPSRGWLSLLLGYLRGLESLEGAPSWPQQQREPRRGGQAQIPAFGIIPLLPAWPRGSLGRVFPCQNTPNPSSAPGGGAGPPPHLSHHEFWVSPAILSSRIPGVWGGGVSITGQRLPGGRAGGAPGAVPPPKKPGTVYGAWSLIDVFVHYKFCSRIFFKTFAGFGFCFFFLCLFVFL